MQPSDFINLAKELAASGGRKPKQVHLRRSVSTAYYAMFHALARCCSDSVIGSKPVTKNAWRHVYRALDHGSAKNACINMRIIARFPTEIQDFANMFVQMQKKRHAADYDPHERHHKSSVLIDISAVESVIKKFKSAKVSDRRAFAALVLFKDRA